MAENVASNTRPAGWAWPLNLRKAHYFAEGAGISLCGKVMYLGSQREQGNDGSKDNCADCKRRLAKRTPPAPPGAQGEEAK
jgi:hypothetical protein